MRHLLFTVALAGISAGFLAACNGSDGEAFDWPSPPDLTGTWKGTFSGTDGSGSLTLVISSHNTVALPAGMQGTWTQDYTGGSSDGGFFSSGSSIVINSQGMYAINVGVTYDSGCGANLASATLNEAETVFTGSYGGDCGEGTFTIARQ